MILAKFDINKIKFVHCFILTLIHCLSRPTDEHNVPPELAHSSLDPGWLHRDLLGLVNSGLEHGLLLHVPPGLAQAGPELG